MKVGLIGKTLSHSFSKPIHEQLADYTYELFPMEEEAFHIFMKEKPFDAVNVTIPYKEKVMEYCDEIDERAKAIGAVNAIVKRDGKLLATNTDFAGLSYMIRAHHIAVQDKVCCILGTGGTSKTARAVLEAMGAANIYMAGRRALPDVLSYEELKGKQDIQVFVNATSVGMYPHGDEQLIDLSDYPNAEAVVDVIYNPLQTTLCMQAEERGLSWVCGLEMLVAQAKYAVEFFEQRTIEDEEIARIVKALKKEMTNLVLIGMPGSGKTTVGRKAAAYLHRPFVDLDREIVKEEGMEIREIFETYGEAHFRELEEAVTRKWAMEHGLVISCGGGVVKRPENMRRLKRNGVIFQIDRDVEKLPSDPSRPLSTDRERLRKMEEERRPLYEKYRDHVVKNEGTAEETARKIERNYNEVFDHQRTEY